MYGAFRFIVVAIIWCVPALATAEPIAEAADAAYARADYLVAIRLYRQLANQGRANAQLDLGNMYHEGQGVSPDYAEALKWYRLAADQGLQTAQSNLGSMYHKGQGVTQSYVEAANWYRKAADQGDPASQFNLGNMYGKGQGVPQSYTEEMMWYFRAANQGMAKAQFNLGNMFAEGQGVSQQEYILAHMWLSLAAAQGLQQAIRNRNTLANLMTPAQLVIAETLAREWKPK